MSVASVREFPGVSVDDFDRLRTELGTDPPRGLILHVAGPSPAGWRTIDIWETRADSVRYEQEQLGPAIERAGLTPAALQSELSVHHLLRGDGLGPAPAQWLGGAA